MIRRFVDHQLMPWAYSPLAKKPLRGWLATQLFVRAARIMLATHQDQR